MSSTKSCDKIESVVLSSSLEAIPNYCFTNCFSLSQCEIPNSVITIGEQAFYATSIEKAILPNSVIEVGSMAFMNCVRLKSASVSESMSAVPASMFSSCSALSEVKIPENVKTISRNAFNECSSLTAVSLAEIETLGENAFSGCKGLASIQLPATIRQIGNHTFTSCTALRSIAICDGIESIGEYSFQQCSALESIEIPGSVNTISDGAFSKCEALKSVVIGEGVSSIGEEAFYNCAALERVKLASTLNEIGQNAFAKDDNIKFVEYITDSPREFDSIIFPADANLYILRSSADECMNILPWKYFTKTTPCGLSLSHSKVSLNHKTGVSHQFEASLVAVPGENYSMSWRASAPEVARVDDSGLVTPQSVGQSTVTCRAEGDMGNIFVASADVDVIGVTGIEEIIASGIIANGNDNADVYNLQGVLVKSKVTLDELLQLETGIYIVNGRKIFVR